MFFAPPEVNQSILDLRKKKSYDKVDSYDVICWLLQQTCDSIEQLQPLYYSQGSDFCRRMQASVDHGNFLADIKHRDSFLSSVRTIEQQTLEQLYGSTAKTKGKATKSEKTFCDSLTAFRNELNARKATFQDTGNAVHGSALQEVEQEREVAYEGTFLDFVKRHWS